jgi:hypothetical protein
MTLKRQNLTGDKSNHNPQAGSGRLGGIGDLHKRGEHATVVAFNSDTFAATVKTESGRTLSGVPCLRASPGDVAPLPIGTEVLISYDYGFPVIMGCLSLPTSNSPNTPTHSITDVDGYGGNGFNKATLPEGNFRRPGEPTDLIPGDWAKVGPEGNAIAVLGGGSTILKSGPLSQIRTHLINDLVEIISRNYRHITDMGEFTVRNDAGRVNMSFRGASDQRSEAGPDEEHWTIRMDMGAVGDMFNLQFTTSKGQTLFKFHVDASGHCEIYGVNGINISSGSRYKGKHAEEHTGNSEKTVGGNQTTTVGGTETRSYGNTVKEIIGGNYECSINNDWRAVAIRDIALSAGRSLYLNVIGNPLATSPAAVFDFTNGSWNVNIGTLASIPLTAGFNMTAHNSDINHSVVGPGKIVNDVPAGSVINNSLLHFLNTNNAPNSVVLGGSIPIGQHLVMHEALITYLTTLHTMLDTHTHLIPGTATAGPFTVAGITGPGTVPGVFASLSSAFPAFGSKVALVTF